jgi:integrase
MNISVRQRPSKKQTAKLYLDFYIPGSSKKRTGKTLDLYVFKDPKTKDERRVNKEMYAQAERIKAAEILRYSSDVNGWNNQKEDIYFIPYFRKIAETKKNSNSNYSVWVSAINLFEKYYPKDILIKSIDITFIEKFKQYLKTKAFTKSGKLIATNTSVSYFNKFLATLNYAFQDKHINDNISKRVKSIKTDEVVREYLSHKEIQKLMQTDCKNPMLKKAFLFSCLTGLRFSDIDNLEWKKIKHDPETDKTTLSFRQLKTRGLEKITLSKDSIKFLPERRDAEDKVFRGLKYSALNNWKLTEWVLRAEITKVITFHCARHTYAILQLENGTDIFTLKNLLGHKDLKTTMVYAKVVDKKVEEAADAIPSLNFDSFEKS